ncbi:MAG TPA: class I SAM-dependent methyltransferase [Vicinamibacterales bacterium]|jgi:SAM-dependent methyltransferase|nr:class I SAM-dependent methyltransferase [Vicinamibacterales bacterium]
MTFGFERLKRAIGFGAPTPRGTRSGVLGPLSPRDAYELWADDYPPMAHNALMRSEQSVVEPILAHLRPARALDVGTGSGRYIPILESTGARIVIGVDYSLGMLTRGHDKVHRICADACQLPFRRGTFDLINASLMMGDVADLSECLRSMCRVLSSRGHIVYSDFHPSWSQNGWRRTFHLQGGHTCEVAIEPHTIEDHLYALDQAGLHVQAIREPRLSLGNDGHAPSLLAFRRRWGNPPVVVVFHVMREP